MDGHLRPGGIPVATLVKTTFAMLQQSHPQLSELYQQRRLWEDMAADNAAARLRTILTDTVDRQRDLVRNKLTGKATVIFAPLRWLLTIGALIWFPFVQPVLETLLMQNQMNWSVIHETHELVVLTVRIFSVNELLQNVTFLGIYFFVLWVTLRWDTQRQISRFASKWKADSTDLSLTVQTVRWMDELLMPVRVAKEKIDQIALQRSKITGAATSVATGGH